MTVPADDDAFTLTVALNSLIQLLEGWAAKAKAYRDAHYQAAVQLRGRHYQLGIPTVILSAVVGTTVFASLQATMDGTVAFIVGALSIGAAVMAALQTFLRFGERAELHRQASASFEAFAQQADYVIARYQPAKADKQTIAELDSAAQQLQERFSSLTSTAPELSKKHRTKEGLLPSTDGLAEAAFTPKATRGPRPRSSVETATRKRGPSDANARPLREGPANRLGEHNPASSPEAPAEEGERAASVKRT